MSKSAAISFRPDRCARAARARWDAGTLEEMPRCGSDRSV